MARYVPKHRKKRRLRDQQRVAGAAGLFAAAAISLSGTFGYVPGAVADPLATPGGVVFGVPRGPVTAQTAQSALRVQPPVAPAINARTARLPTFVSIPAIGASSELVQLGLETDGAVEVPVDFNQAGWYRFGPAPGEKGAAIILGHLQSYERPAIFARLSQLKPLDLVRVARRDGVRLTFQVTRIDEYPKEFFPADNVYGDTDEPELRLITCGGTFNRRTRSYEKNTVVYAKLISRN